MNQYLLIKQGNIHNAVEKEAFTADILIENGKIKKIAPVLEGAVINDAEIIDASGIDVYPGFVDAHCHLGLDGYAVEYAGDDFNEIGDAITPELSALDAVNPQDKAFELARAGGVTCVSTGPGSSNVIGGTFCVIKTYGKRIDDMIVKEKSAMKIAFGENPKNCYKSRGIYSRMTIAAKLREVLRQAELYEKRQEAAGYPDNTDYSKMPEYNAKLEALLPVIRKELPLKAHVHRADDIFTAIRIAKEFDLNSFGYATKYELKNKSFSTPADLADAGCSVCIITDSPVSEEQYLPLCAGKAIASGLDEFTALQAVTINAAKHIEVQDRVGSIEEGKDADFVLVKGSPFAVDTKILYTIIDGKIVYKNNSL